MKKLLITIIAVLAYSCNVHAETLADLINKNVQQSVQNVEQTGPRQQQSNVEVQLWIHVRNSRQEKVARQILDRIARTKLQNLRIEKKPVQIVTSGPKISQLRYFKKADRDQVAGLFGELRKSIPTLELSDASAAYDSVSWIKLGHYELWLAPDIVNLAPE